MRMGMLAVLVWGCGILAGAGETVRVRADLWPPFNSHPGLGKEGYMIEVLRQIFQKRGLEIDYQLATWTEALEAAKSGECDAVVGVSQLEAAGLVLPAEDFGRAGTGFYVRAGDPWRFAGVESLKGKRLGCAIDYDYGPLLNNYIKENLSSGNIVQFGGDEAADKNINELLCGRIDVALECPVVMEYRLNEFGANDKVIAAGPILDREPIYAAFTPRDEKGYRLAEIFDQGLAELRRNGELARIMAKYGLKDWK